MEKILTDNFLHTPATPEGFSITTDVVSEEAWEEIKLYLGLSLRTTETETDIDINNKGECIDKNDGRPLSRIIWELTPSPQNRPVAQFGFRYDYKRGIVVVPVEGNSTVPFKEEEEKEDNEKYDKKIDSGATTTTTTTTTNGHNDSENAKAITTVPKIPELFKLLLLQPYYNQQTRNGKYDCTDDMNDEHEYEIENENENKIENFTQAIINVYRPTTMMNKTMNNSYSSNYESCGGDNTDEDDTTDTASTCSNRSSSRERSTTSPTQHCRIGSHIPWHVDDPRFGPVILVFTFGETRPLNMRLVKHTTTTTTTTRNRYDSEVVVDDDDDDSDNSDDRSSRNHYSYFTAHPPHLSCYQLSGMARTKWEHSIPTGTGWRVSITFRTVVEKESRSKR